MTHTAVIAYCGHCGAENALFTLPYAIDTEAHVFTAAERAMIDECGDDACAGCGYTLWGSAVGAEIKGCAR